MKWQNLPCAILQTPPVFVNSAKKDSTGICFIGERKFKAFLQQFLLNKPGDIITADAKTIGQHDGLMYYTLGQRQGIGIGGKQAHDDLPWYVADKNMKTNQLTVVQGCDHPMLYKQHLNCEQVHWINQDAPSLPLRCTAKIRYRQTDQACEVSMGENNIQVRFNNPQRAITPGQSVVFYRADECLGGGVIQTTSS